MSDYAIYCGIINDDCSVCFAGNPPAGCWATMPFYTAQAPNTSLYLWIKDKFDRIYYDVVTVHGDGSIILDTENFPEGLFNNNGTVQIFLSTDQNAVDLIDFSTTTVLTVLYSCVSLPGVHSPIPPVTPPGICAPVDIYAIDGITLIATVPSGGSYVTTSDPLDADALANCISAGITDLTYIRALSNLYTGLKGSGMFTLIRALYLWTNLNSLDSNLRNIINPGTFDLGTYGFGDSDLSLNGFKGDGVSKYFDTNLNPFAEGIDMANFGWGVISRTFDNYNNTEELSLANSDGSHAYYLSCYDIYGGPSLTKMVADGFINQDTDIATLIDSGGVGICAGTTAVKAYTNGFCNGTPLVPSSGLVAPNGTIKIFQAVPPYQAVYSYRELAGAWIDEGFTDSQEKAMNVYLSNFFNYLSVPLW